MLIFPAMWLLVSRQNHPIVKNYFTFIEIFYPLQLKSLIEQPAIRSKIRSSSSRVQFRA